MTTDGERESDLACGASFTRDDGHKGHCCIDVEAYYRAGWTATERALTTFSSAFHASWHADL